MTYSPKYNPVRSKYISLAFIQLNLSCIKTRTLKEEESHVTKQSSHVTKQSNLSS